jgi:hypothetical protein
LPAVTRVRRQLLLGHTDQGDFRGNGYTLVTYRASHLPKPILDASEVILVTCESDPSEVAALHHLCRSTEPVELWRGALGSLALGEAAALPITEEAGASLRRVHLGLRVTHHVRHREKYVDVPVAETRAFVFTSNQTANGARATTLREFAEALDTHPSRCLEGHA